jgi:hypothetical protein
VIRHLSIRAAQERPDLAGTVAARWRVIGTPALENEASRIAGDQPHGVDLP